MTLDRLSSINVSRVLQAIYQRGTCSRPELSVDLNMDRSTVSKIVGSLADRGIVEIGAKGSSTARGGRRPSFISLNRSAGHVIGIELQTDGWYAVGTDLDGDILFALSGPVAEDEQDALDVIEEVAAQLKPISDRQSIPLLGVVVAMPGIIDPYQATIVQSNPLNIHAPTSIVPPLQKHLPVPVVAENDANACCWGEIFQNRNEVSDNFLCVLVELRRTHLGARRNAGIGVGLGIVIEQHVHYGRDFSAGEFQSVFWNRRSTSQFNLTEEETLHITDDVELLSRVFTELSRNLAVMVNTFNLSEIVIVGDLSAHRERFTDILRFEINDNWSYDTRATCAVRFTDLGRETVAFGAASMFVERLFTVPDQRQTHRYPAGIDLFDIVLPYHPSDKVVAGSEA